jgi:nucleoside-diphosphate-sugar epimerase
VTATKHVILWCDAEGCARFIEISAESAFGPARAIAREEGWRTGRPPTHTRGAGQDFCPEHATGETEPHDS